MPIAESEIQAARRQLDRIFASSGLARNERLTNFLRFIVDKHLEGKDNEIKESVLAVEVFGRRPDHDPKQDSIVRTEAARLRARLTEYYAGEGKNDSIVIELPKGGYVPVIREVQHDAAAEPSPRPSVLPPSDDNARRHFPRLAAIAVLASTLAVGALGWWWMARQRAPVSVAVLPLANLSRDAANDYFADGLTVEIIRNLSILDGLAVRSQTSSFALKGRGRNIREAGKELDAEYILEGSVFRSDQQLRINVQLVRVRDDFALWSGQYDQELSDATAIQDEISRGIVNSLRLKLGRGQRRYETSTEAYDLYLRARALRLGEDGKVAAFEQAVAKDPAFAPAYAGLAATHAFRSGLFRVDPAIEISKMRTAAEKAIRLDPMLAEAHEGLAIAYARDADWKASEKEFRRAFELDPNRSETHLSFTSFLLVPLNRTGEALSQLRLAQKADPLSARVHSVWAYILPSLGRFDEAAAHCEKMPADSSIRAGYLGRIRFLQGRTAEAIQILEAELQRGVPPGSEVRAFLGYAYARTGRRADAEKMLINTNPFNQAVIFAGLGDTDHAIEAMERGATAGPFRIGRQLTWPELASIRNDPRIKALRRKFGLPD